MILITGGLGYIGSHIALDLISKGHEVVLVDNLSQSSNQIFERLEYITNSSIPFVRLDVRNTPVLQKIFEQHPIEYVIHCAGLKSVADSKKYPLEYYNNNASCLVSLLRAMQRAGVRRLVNISSSMVYGKSGTYFSENDECSSEHNNPYIRITQQNESMLKDMFAADDYWQISNVRLTNVVGTFNDCKIGEWVFPSPKSILPRLLQVSGNQREFIELYQQDLDTEDGTAERDYVHIMDVVQAIYQILIWSNYQQNFFENFNVGSGKLSSIKQLIKTVEEVTLHRIPIQDAIEQVDVIAQNGVNLEKIRQLTGWIPTRSLAKAVGDQWAFYQRALSKVSTASVHTVQATTASGEAIHIQVIRN